jgi:hypothetical protein
MLIAIEKVVWWARKDLNLGPMDYESTALTAELQAHTFMALGDFIALVEKKLKDPKVALGRLESRCDMSREV